MIEHKHWTRKSKDGIHGQHIAIVGYSHYRNELKDEDSDDFTQCVMDIYLSGDKKMGSRFFPPIQRYFGYEDSDAFWKRVDFFNLIPECFTSGEKFAFADQELAARSRARFKRILSREKPDKIFVFSRKGWRQCPDTLEEAQPLKANPRDTWGTYEVGDHVVRACGFRHPLFARFEDMSSAVNEFLNM